MDHSGYGSVDGHLCSLVLLAQIGYETLPVFILSSSFFFLF